MGSAAYPTRLASLAQEAAVKLKRSKEYLTSASILLAECKRRVDEGDPEAYGAAWPEYCRVHFSPYSESYIARLVRVGSQPDVPDGDAGAARKGAFNRAWSAFIALDRKRQHEFLRYGTAYVVRPEGKTGRWVSGTPADLPNAVDRLA